MTHLTFKTYQSYLKLKYKDIHQPTGLFMKLIEEVGEAAEILNKLDGRKKNDGDHNLESELVDIIHYTIAIAAVCNLDITEAILEKDKTASLKYSQVPTLETWMAEDWNHE